MSKLSKLFGKGRLIKLGGKEDKENEIELEIKPLTLENIDVIMDMGDDSKKAMATKRLIELTIKQAVPDSTDEEIKQISLEYTMELMTAILEVNNLGEESSAKAKLIEDVKQRLRETKK